MTALACSAASSFVHEPLAGTAPVALTWIVIEHAGPWGRDAIADAALPDEVRATLVRWKAAGIGVLLGRPIDRASAEAEPRILLARTAPGGTLLRQGTSAELADLRMWSPDALASGHLPAFGTAARTPVLLVCTQGKRDACCAVHGRELLRALTEAASPTERSSIWESSHIGGHRFSPVALSLPSGEIHGRMRANDARRLLSATCAGEVIPELLRGRSTLPPPLQRACVEIRQLLDITDADALDALLAVGDRVVPADAHWQPTSDSVLTHVRHSDGRAWAVTVHRSAIHPRPESCGADPVPGSMWTVAHVAALGDWR